LNLFKPAFSPDDDGDVMMMVGFVGMAEHLFHLNNQMSFRSQITAAICLTRRILAVFVAPVQGPSAPVYMSWL